MKTSTAIIVILVILALLGLGWWYVGNNAAPATGGQAQQPIATATFACDAGKSISASFYQGSSTPSTDSTQPPTPGGSVALTLSDGRSMTLAQTISADGVRYANADESFIFWGKGNTAFVEEGADQNQTYTGCIVVAPDTTGVLSQIYATSTAGFSIRFPAGYTADPSYSYQALGPGKSIPGVKITIPASVATGTNLASDTYVSVEWLPKATNSCTADLFLDAGSRSKVTTFSDGGVDYSVATSSDAGAGNRYDEAVFAIPGTSPCTAIRYFIHYGAIENYPAGAVTEFDRSALVNTFDAIRRTLVLGR
ncbi:MAG TPA: MliC family protein [Candidatus Paceibacterota bacterium]|nr:MliC family protein [Candidatus Paceibacterota bacterium]